jgi:hypothetical protein
MRRLSALAIAMALVLTIAGSASAHDAGRGFLPPHARVHGQNLRQIAGDWLQWGFGSPADTNPLLANRCEQDPNDKHIWFLPVSLGGDYAIDCHVPSGVFLVVTPGGYECSEAEGNGSTKAELKACVDEFFADLSHVELALDGRAAKHLDRYVVTTPMIQLAGPNLLSDNATSSMDKGYFVVIAPLSRGKHTVRAYDEFAAFDFTAGITMNITVGHGGHRHH